MYICICVLTLNCTPFLVNSIGIGTPQEDAFRRDLTINALFYNLQEEIVEDFTGVSIYLDQSYNEIFFLKY